MWFSSKLRWCSTDVLVGRRRCWVMLQPLLMLVVNPRLMMSPASVTQMCREHSATICVLQQLGLRQRKDCKSIDIENYYTRRHIRHTHMMHSVECIRGVVVGGGRKKGSFRVHSVNSPKPVYVRQANVCVSRRVKQLRFLFCIIISKPHRKWHTFCGTRAKLNS